MHKVEYGTVEKTSVIDDDGSTLTKVEDYNNGVLKVPQRHVYKMRVRVKNSIDEQKEYMLFSKQLETTPTMLDPVFSIEHSNHGNANGYYYAVKQFTTLEY